MRMLLISALLVASSVSAQERADTAMVIFRGDTTFVEIENNININGMSQDEAFERASLNIANAIYATGVAPPDQVEERSGWDKTGSIAKHLLWAGVVIYSVKKLVEHEHVININTTVNGGDNTQTVEGGEGGGHHDRSKGHRDDGEG